MKTIAIIIVLLLVTIAILIKIDNIKKHEIPYKYVGASIKTMVLEKGKTYRITGNIFNMKIIDNGIIMPEETIKLEPIGMVSVDSLK